MPTRHQLSTLGYALLSLLARGQSSGYDLAQRMQRPIGYFWRAHRSQIYPELERLAANGLVTHERVEQQDRPDKKVYTLTEAGCEALRAWIISTPTPAPPRDELVLRAYSLWLADPEQAIALFRQEEERHAAQLAAYEATIASMERECGGDLRQQDSPQFGNYLALMRGIGYEREYAAWCRWVVEELERNRTPE
jgi:DNA-binding PadR family transcriptional regulator